VAPCAFASVASAAPFVGDFEVASPGWQQFGGLQYEQERPVSESFEIVADPVRQGRNAARFVVRQGYSQYGYGEDTEVEWHSFERPGDDYWYAWSTLFPEDWEAPHGWGIFAQWHARLSTSPVIAFNARTNSVVLNVHAGLTDERLNSFQIDRNVPILRKLAKGRWNDFVMHVRWSTGPDGAIEVFHRVSGAPRLKRVASLRNIPTFQRTKTGAGVGAYLLFGLYRGSYCSQPTTLGCTRGDEVQEPSVVYQDAFVRARTFKAAASIAFPREVTVLAPPRPAKSARPPRKPGRVAAPVRAAASPIDRMDAFPFDRELTVVAGVIGIFAAVVLARRLRRR